MRYILGIIFSLFCFCGFTQSKILMIVAPIDFRDEELTIPKEIFESNGYYVEIASNKKGKAIGMLGEEVEVELTIDEINLEDYDALVLVGGVGAQVYWQDNKVLSLIRRAFDAKKVIGAICIAPVCLANSGILKNRRATVWPSEKTKLQDNGAIYVSEDVVVDDRIITANGPQSAKKFAEKILEELKK